MTNYKYDLHTHGFTNWHVGKYGSLEKNPPREPRYFLEAMKRAELKGIVLANFGKNKDWEYAYEEFRESAQNPESCGEYQLTKELENALIFTDKKNSREFYIIKGQELSPVIRKVHIMGIGLKKGEAIPSGLGLEKTIQELKSTGAIINADHYNGILGMGENNLREYANKIDVFEGNNQNYSHLILSPIVGMNPSVGKADALAHELGINWISVSDCHKLKDLGTGYIDTPEEIDTSSPDNLRESLREILRFKKFNCSQEQKMPISSVLEHMIIAKYDQIIRNRLGWSNLE